jgi:hypothetical protein
MEVREVLRCWLAGDGLRTAAERAGVDRKTARRYVVAAQVAGLVRGGGEGQLTDELIGAVIAAVRFTAVYSRHMFVWQSFTQTLAAVIAGCEAAWAHFGGVFRVIVPDNMSPVVADADPVNPTFTAGWLDYAQARGFGADPARVRSPKDKPRGGAGCAVRARELLRR